MRAKAYRTIVILGLFSALGASALAQSGPTMQVPVPFDFQVGKTRFPAGTYAVTPVSPDLMRLCDAGGRIKALIQAPLTAEAPVGAQQAADPARLVFHRYGERYFLAQVWTHAGNGRGLYMSARERRLARELRLWKRGRASKLAEGGAAQPQTVEVAALARR